MKRLNFIDKIIFIINLIVAILLLLSFFGSYVSVKSIPFLSVLNLTVSVLVFFNVLFLIYWVLRRKRMLLLSFSMLIASYFVLEPFLKFSDGDKEVELHDDLTIMSFNTRGFNENEGLKLPNIDKQIVDFVKKENPDIVCFQEFDWRKIRSKDFENYKYKYVDFIFGEYRGKVVQAIYSQYPILNKGVVEFPKSSNSIIYADILYKNDTIRVYSIHLQSLRIIPTVGGVTSEPSDKLYKRLTHSFVKQQEQAKIFLNHAEKTPYKKIICGDFNNNQYSNVYHLIKGDMVDTFLEKGKGFGRTYDFMGYPLRIDFILADQDFEVLAHKNYDVRLSDHYPVMSSLRLKPQ